MLIHNLNIIGNKLLAYRKRLGLRQLDVAEAANLSERAYADIERGNTNFHVDTLLNICNALHITPNDILTEEPDTVSIQKNDIFNQLSSCTNQEQELILKLLSVYLDEIKY
ncbi:MAG: helix-turn-helix transcriptional regulator [Clostridiales bacterium]|nr:helix-turn-helix transcriptional regulator [Clostridiales bacterium]